MTHTDPRTSRADLVAIVAALAVSIGVLVIDPDVVAGRQLPGIAIAATDPTTRREQPAPSGPAMTTQDFAVIEGFPRG